MERNDTAPTFRLYWPKTCLLRMYAACLRTSSEHTHYDAFSPSSSWNACSCWSSFFLEELTILERSGNRFEFKLQSTKMANCSGQRDFENFAYEPEFQGKGIWNSTPSTCLIDSSTDWIGCRDYLVGCATASGWYMKKREGLFPSDQLFYKGPEEDIQVRIDFWRGDGKTGDRSRVG